jgi:hypothetical protein
MSTVSFSLDEFFPHYVDIYRKPPTIYDSLNSEVESKEYSPFYTSIPMKKEFAELRTTENLVARDFNGVNLYNHQEFMARFMSPHTPYNRMLVFHQVGTGKCVHPDTLVDVVAGEAFIHQKISQIFAKYKGDHIPRNGEGKWYGCDGSVSIRSFDPTSRTLINRKILRFYTEEVNTSLKKYITSSGKDITCTFQHKLFCGDKGFTNDIRPGDWVYTVGSHGEPVAEQITSVGLIKYVGTVYDLEVDEYHTYVADGFVTHNTCLMVTVAEAAMRIDPDVGKMIILVPSDTLLRNPRKALVGSCTNGKYKSKVVDDSGKRLNEAERNRQITNNIKPFYQIQTYLTFAKEIEKLTDEEMIAKYTNTYLFIDEAHYLKESGESATRIKYQQIRRFLHTVPSVKALLLTGTPMMHSADEIVPLINLINPEENSLDKDMFNSWWADDKFTHGEEFKARWLFGKVSHVATRNVQMFFTGDELDPPAYEMAVVKLDMEKHQSDGYKLAVREDQQNEETEEEEDDMFGDEPPEGRIKDEDKDSFGWKSSRAASNFVFQDSRWDTEKNYMTVNTEPSPTGEYRPVELKPALRNFLNRGVKSGMSEDEIFATKLSALRQLSVKFAYIVGLLRKGRKTFVYTDKVFGNGGLLLGAVLQEFGWSAFSPKTKSLAGVQPAKRFVILSGTTTDSKDLNHLLNTDKEEDRIVNSRKNMRGEIVQVILGSKKASEGVDITHIRDVVVLNAWWNMPRLDQAIGRATRSGGHDGLPRDEQNVTIHRLVAQPILNLDEPEEEDFIIDAYMYMMAEERDKKTKQIERLLKEASVDCVLNRSRNIMQGQDGSRLCDYTTCDIKCDSVPPQFNNPSYFKWGIIDDTYNLFYAEQEIKTITDTVVKLFGIQSSWSFYDLASEMPKSIGGNSLVLARALGSIISNNIPITNRLGFVNYLREENNVYFLVDDPAGTILHTLAWYSSNPTPRLSGSSGDVAAVIAKENFAEIIESLQRTADDKEKTMRKIKMLPADLQSIFEDICASIAPEEKTTLCQTIASFGQKLIWDEDLYNWVWFDGAIKYTRTSREFLIRKKPLVRLTAKGTVDTRRDRPGTACGTGEFGGRYLLWLVWWLNKRGIAKGIRGPLSQSSNDSVVVNRMIESGATTRPGELLSDIVKTEQCIALAANWMKNLDGIEDLTSKKPREGIEEAELMWWFHEFSHDQIKSWFRKISNKTDSQVLREGLQGTLPAINTVLKPDGALLSKEICPRLQEWFATNKLLREI